MRLASVRAVVSAAILVHCSSSSPTLDGGADVATDSEKLADSSSDASDAGVDAAVESGADVAEEPDAAPLCDPYKPFGQPVEITELNTVGLYVGLPRLTHDELTVYFDAADNGVDAGLTWTGAQDIVRATRASLTSPFTSFTVLSSINTTGNDMRSCPSGDDLALFFGSNALNGPANMYVATRPNTNTPFSSSAPLSITTSLDDEFPYVLPDTLTLYYAALTNGSKDLVRATRATASDPFTIDTSGIFAKVNTSLYDEVAPAVSLDELTLYFAGAPGTNNGDDIYVSTRPNKTSQFALGKLLYASTSSDRPGFISDDGCRLYISSLASGNFKIYVMTRPL